MGLPLSGHRARELLSIETEDFQLAIKGPVKNKVVEAFRLHQDENGDPMQAKLTVSGNYITASVYDSSGGYVEHGGGFTVPCFFEQVNYEFILEKKNDCLKKLEVEHLNINIRQAISPVGSGERLLTGIINFQDEVGFSRFEVLGDGQTLLSFEIEVFPSKLDYQRDYWRLLQEVNEEVYNLAYEFLMRTSFYAALTNEKQPTQAEFYYIFKAINGKLFKALERLKEKPNHKIIPVNRVVPPARVKKAGRKAASWLEKRSHLFEKDGQGIVKFEDVWYTPRKALDTKKELTYDTYENRFLKWLLRQLDAKLKVFSDRYKGLSEKVGDQRVLDEITTVRRRLQRYLRTGFLQEVGELKQVEHSSLVMQMAPGYRDVYRCYLMLLKGLHISSDMFSISVKGLAELYEYWCFLKLNALLRKKYRLERNDLIAIDRKGITVNLKKGQASCLTYKNPRNGETFTITYNQSFTKLPTISQRPDNILKLNKSGSSADYQYIFDAKYRISVEDEYIKAFGQAGPPEDTINTMHRYRDSIIGSAESKDDLRRDVFGAFVLFPHNDELAYAGRKNNSPSKFYDSLEHVGIGALPFLPGQTTLVEELLDELIFETPESAFERTVLQDGTKDYLTKDEKRNVLIGPLSSKEQLDLCLGNNMYYTYLERVQPFLRDLEYVAIYQSKQLFKQEEAQGIQFYGRIKDYEVLRRNEISEASDGRWPQKLAIKFEVERWQRRLEVIKPGGYGPAKPQSTSWHLFKEAQVYPELHLGALEVRLWRELKRIQDCLSVQFPRDRINATDQMESMEFPGLVVEKLDMKTFKLTVGSQEKVFIFDTLHKRPGKTLKDIISFWKTFGRFPDSED